MQIKENIKAPGTGLCEGNSPVTGEFPAQRASNAEIVSILWRHHVHVSWCYYDDFLPLMKCSTPSLVLITNSRQLITGIFRIHHITNSSLIDSLCSRCTLHICRHSDGKVTCTSLGNLYAVLRMQFLIQVQSMGYGWSKNTVVLFYITFIAVLGYCPHLYGHVLRDCCIRNRQWDNTQNTNSIRCDIKTAPVRNLSYWIRLALYRNKWRSKAV